MRLVKNVHVPTGNIFVSEHLDKKKLEFLCIGDYGKEKNMKAQFMGLDKDIEIVPHGDMLPLEEKTVITISTQFGCQCNCNFCDVPNVRFGGNATEEDLLYQVITARNYHPHLKGGERLNIHYARMGEPSYNHINVCESARKLVRMYGDHFKTVHPVVSTMMPDYHDTLRLFIEKWLSMKAYLFNGESGLQLSINSTDGNERISMFGGRALSLQRISSMMKNVLDTVPVIGRKITLNFALGGYEIDAKYLKKLFDPDKFLVKLTPMHRTNGVVRGGIPWEVDYKDYEKDLINEGLML